MNRPNSFASRFRAPLLLAAALLLTTQVMRQAAARNADQAVELPCHELPLIEGYYPYALPDAHYLFSETYGWLDTTHFNTGRPAQVLADVRAAVAAGGGVVTIRQGIHDDITGYTGSYAISGDLDLAGATTAAMGIYLDWSVRFEGWQAGPPQGLLGPTSPFAVEDLPSQYLGFMAAAYNVPVARLVACYIGPVTGSDDGPPDIVPYNSVGHDGVLLAAGTYGPFPTEPFAEGWTGLSRLDNPTFQPLVPSSTGWHHVDWPPELVLEPLPAGPGTWRYLSDTTWYLGDTDEDLHLTTVYRSLERRAARQMEKGQATRMTEGG